MAKDGKGGVPNVDAAVGYFKESARKGYRLAKERLYELSKEDNNPLAQYHLGMPSHPPFPDVLIFRPF